MDIQILTKAGLTETQAKCYLALLEHGALLPTELADITGETRTNSYAVVEKLMAMGLVHKKESSKLKIEAENPTKIRSLINARQQQLKIVNDELSGVLPTLLSKYRLTSDQPGVISAEGAEALEIVYHEIINSKQEVLIFPCKYDRDDPEISELIDEQIVKQRKAKIKSLSLVSAENYEKIKAQEDGLLSIRKLPEGVSFPAQIIIFGDIVVSTVFKPSLVSTIISSPETAATLRSIFFIIWNSTSA